MRPLRRRVPHGLFGAAAVEAVPTVAIIFGMAILFYYDDHEPPHFHVRASGFRAKFDLEELVVAEIEGQMRPQDFARLREWTIRHHAELYANWHRARRKEPLLRIED